MEARVDIKKLQLLNDRIVQTIEALNQVRLTVHGLSHAMNVPGTVGAGAAFGQAPIGIASQTALPYNPSYSSFGAMPFGLSHSNLNPLTPPVFGTAVGAPGYMQPFGAQSPALGTQVASWPSVGSTGLSHSTIEEQWIAELRAQDPRRLAQTFPYCYTP